jgi:hypothetical protein
MMDSFPLKLKEEYHISTDDFTTGLTSLREVRV